MTLYSAEISFDIVVEANDEQQALSLMRRFAGDEVANGRYDVCGFGIVTDVKQVPADWRDSIPWYDGWYDGLSDDRTVLQRLEPLKTSGVPRKDTPT